MDPRIAMRKLEEIQRQFFEFRSTLTMSATDPGGYVRVTMDGLFQTIQIVNEKMPPPSMNPAPGAVQNFVLMYYPLIAEASNAVATTIRERNEAEWQRLLSEAAEAG